MQGGMAWYADPPVSLPIQDKLIRFALCRQNGLSSNSWRVWVEKHGDVYIACRDHLGDIKISLHRSGKCHVASDHKALVDGDRYMGRWERLLTTERKFVLPFRLLFPNSSLCLNQELRDTQPKIWDSNRVYIEAPESPFGTIVSFIIVDESVTSMNSEKSLSYPLAVMSAWPGTRLWVVVSHEYEGEMLRVAWDYMNKLLGEVNDDLAQKLGLEKDAKVFTITIRGWTNDGNPYLMPFPVEMGKT